MNFQLKSLYPRKGKASSPPASGRSWLRSGILLAPLVVSALTSSAVNGYFFSAGSDGSFAGLTESQIGGINVYVIPEVDLSGIDTPVFTSAVSRSWTLHDVINRNVWIKISGSDEWYPITIDRSGLVILPSETRSVAIDKSAMSGGDRLQYIRISAQNRNFADDTDLAALDCRIVKGVSADGVIRPDAANEIEIALSHPDLEKLSQPRGKFGFRLCENSGFASVSFIAVTPDGEITFDSSWDIECNQSGAYVYMSEAMLPANTSELHIKWSFKNSDDNNGIMWPGISGDPDDDFCVSITQPGHHGRLLPVWPIQSAWTSADSSLWYDVDSDGEMELADRGLYKLRYDRYSLMELNQEFVTPDRWVNYGADDIALVKEGVIYKVEGKEATPVHTAYSGYSPALSVIDYNNDGRDDIWVMNEDNKVLTYYRPGEEFEENYMKLMTPAEYYDYVEQHGGGGLGSGLSVVEGNSGIAGSFGSYRQIDINNDGYLDFIDGTSGVYLMNTGKGSFVKSSFAGRVTFRDFNGDGLNDMLCYDSGNKTLSLILQQKEGEPIRRKLVGGYSCSDRLWCRDFDRDGDIDILVPFNSEDNGGQAFLVMLENNGDGTFRQHETFIDGRVTFKTCADIDGDLNYEVVAVTVDNYDDYDLREYFVVSFAVDGMKVAETPSVIIATNDFYEYSYEHHRAEEAEYMVADYDGSGRRWITVGGINVPLAGEPNTRPDRPAAPKVTFDADSGEVEITWENGNDRETAPLDLSYELRIGTAPDRCDILWVDALPDGRRRSFAEGNCGQTLCRRLNATSWPAGEIYVSLQVIDDGGLGSEFSEYTIFEKRMPASEFSILAPERVAVTDECVIRLTSAPETGAEYEWDLDGAVIIEENGAELRVAWLTPGDRNVTLTVTSADGGTAVRTHSIHIMPARLEKAVGIPYYGIDHALDIDLDGVCELLADKFYEGDADGNYTPLKKLFNSNLSEGYMDRVVDINRDGLPDMAGFSSIRLGWTSGEYYVGKMLNSGDRTMEMLDKEIVPDNYEFIEDLDNDGLTDVLGTNSGYCRNSGNYTDYIPVGDLPSGQSYDYDGDGLIDRIVIDSGKVTVYRNLGGFRFVETESFDAEVSSNAILGDVDADGMMDMVWTVAGSAFGISWYSDNAYVRWNDGSITVIPAPSGHQFMSACALFDFDNNGCQDLLVRLSHSEEYVIIFFDSDHSWVMENVGELNTESVVPYRRSDGHTGFGAYRIVGPANNPPSAPSGLRHEVRDGALVIEWDPSADAETPAPALRYNVSIKRKGIEGEEAYFWSPLNGGLDGVPVPTGARLLDSTMLTIPKGMMSPGNYEVKVQAVDTQLDAGKFSEVHEITVHADNLLILPEETMVGEPTEIIMIDGYHASDFDFGEAAEIEWEKGNTVSVVWNSEGEKHIVCDEYAVSIFVHPALDATFHIPEEVIIGAKVRFDCDNMHNSEWSVLELRDFESIVELGEKGITFTPLGDMAGELVFRRGATPQGLKVFHFLWENYGSHEHSCITHPVSLKENPKITIIDIDDVTGCHRLKWRVPSELFSIADKVNIYKETGRLGEYEVISVEDISTEEYIDPTSDPKTVAGRYCLSYSIPYGETAMTVPHQPIHLQINSGGEGIWNLSWGSYEGRDITSYRILRGSSPQALQCMAEVAGSISSYSDMEASADEPYYAVEILVEDDSAARSGNMLRSRSNVVYVSDITGVEEIESDEVLELTIRNNNLDDLLMVSGIMASDRHPATVRVYDINGILMWSEEICSNVVNIPFADFSNGVYMIVSDGIRLQSGRFVKRR